MTFKNSALVLALAIGTPVFCVRAGRPCHCADQPYERSGWNGSIAFTRHDAVRHNHAVSVWLFAVVFVVDARCPDIAGLSFDTADLHEHESRHDGHGASRCRHLQLHDDAGISDRRISHRGFGQPGRLSLTKGRSRSLTIPHRNSEPEYAAAMGLKWPSRLPNDSAFSGRLPFDRAFYGPYIPRLAARWPDGLAGGSRLWKNGSSP